MNYANREYGCIAFSCVLLTLIETPRMFQFLQNPHDEEKRMQKLPNVLHIGQCINLSLCLSVSLLAGNIGAIYAQQKQNSSCGFNDKDTIGAVT